MENNNIYPYNPYAPPPPGYPPPAPPPPKGLSAPPAGKNRNLALGTVCVLMLVSVAAAVLPFLNGPGVIDSLLVNPLYIGLDAANLLLALLVYLKFILPGWEPHRKTMGWLMGGSLLCAGVLSCYGVIQGAQIGFAAAGGLEGDPIIAGAMQIGTIVGGIVGTLIGIAMNPFFVLIIGIGRKRSTEKVAGVLSAVSLGMGALTLPFTLLMGSIASGVMTVPDTLWVSTVPALLVNICGIIFYFSWPVLDRPVLEKIPQE